MLGLSYGELFLLIGATAALVGPKDLPFIARNAGKLAGRAIGYVQLARGQFDNVMQQSQARQVHKELQDTIAQLEVIRHEIRSISLISPGPSTRRLMDNLEDPAPNVNSAGKSPSEKCGEERKCEDEQKPTNAAKKDYSFKTSGSVDLHSQATAYARLAKSEALKTSLNSVTEKDNLTDEASLFPVLPVSAESTGMLPDRKDKISVGENLSGDVCNKEDSRIAIVKPSIWHVFVHGVSSSTWPGCSFSPAVAVLTSKTATTTATVIGKGGYCVLAVRWRCQICDSVNCGDVTVFAKPSPTLPLTP
ncbi:Sec-independent protein translocase protein TatB [Morella rubra]|uniref:Sec-independent protein translocase protein TatB n=1 Tax=Morella rubra TaxID=262757 RepID=A0A6A1VYL6_9ROSI|nr:Sec-independent protein translocase protein TatB [Morella rubra]